MSSPGAPVRVALLGCGTVGSQVARILVEQAADLRARVGRPLDLVGIATRTVRERPGVDPALLTTDAAALVARPDVDLVVELMGGIHPTLELLTDALAAGKSVVTANKALLAQHGGELFEAAERAGVDIYYEAAVAGAIPIIRPLRESLVGDAVTAVTGIVNGTTNYILDQMHTTGAEYADALADAQALGYAEADPTADVEGHDAAAKAAILASLAFHTRVHLDDVDCEGIAEVGAADIEAAEQIGCVVKLLARCTLSADGTIAVGVHPTLVPATHPLAGVRGAFNAVFVESINAGQLMFMGPGAGGSPTASAVLGDVVTAARNRVRGVAGPGESAYSTPGITDPGRVRSRHHLALVVRDEPGVLARVAAAMAHSGVSIQEVRQVPLPGDGAHARLSITTHVASTADLGAVVAELEASDDVSGRIRVLRVEGE
ncbi:homoserine dehydrogenase [Propioniciclava soli]|uniref:Homoserine dehydrogenase n=1 Tax=Propioniciclava soli TaxID=2775081 RepID=A0ABZ3C2R8_9ACTN|nr:homoserine dehydrogenase [Propioniciclava soli]